MLPSNGKKVKQCLNYHATLDELKIVYDYVRLHHSMMYDITIIKQNKKFI